MYTLRVSHDWALRVQAIRDAVTEDTNLIRFDNGFYRVCRGDAGGFQLQLLPREGARGIVLDMRYRDLYVTRINGRPFETYAQTLDRLRVQPMALDSALLSLPDATGSTLFELQSLIVLCVAESLRNDHMATTIGQVIRTSTTGLVGAPTRLPMAELLDEAHLWGQTSEALFKAMSAAAREIVLKPRAQLKPLQRHFSERIDLSSVEARLQPLARTVKVLKRPG